MASLTRTAALDPLRASRFWLYDVAPIDNLSLPIFTPLTGFTSASAPEVSVETQTIQEGNWPFPRKVVKSADVGNITLTRGVTFYDSDFWRWINAAVHGNTGSITTGQAGIGGVTYRRSLLLIHFFRNFAVPGVTSSQGALTASIAGAAVSGVAISAASGALLAGSGGTTAGIVSGAQLAAMELWGANEPRALGIKVPARAFLLQGCLPVRYKTGSDFDASTGDISIQELELAVELVEEISLAAS